MKVPWQNGAEVEEFIPNGAMVAVRAEGNHFLVYRNEHMGDGDEGWIDQVVGEAEDGRIVVSHNVRYVATIRWKQA